MGANGAVQCGEAAGKAAAQRVRRESAGKEPHPGPPP